MFKKLKKNWYAEDFSYFIRNFGVFTLIFSAMTLIILQVMHSSLYTSVDEKLLSLSNNPQDIIQLEMCIRDRAGTLWPGVRRHPVPEPFRQVSQPRLDVRHRQAPGHALSLIHI